ncbi:hypothetical protein ACVXHA_03505 [Escherichia coli]
MVNAARRRKRRGDTVLLLDLRCDAVPDLPAFLSVDAVDDIIDAHSRPVMVLNRRLRKISSHSVWCDHKTDPALTPWQS